MLDLAKSFLLLLAALAAFALLGGLVLRVLKAPFSLSLALPSGFFLYHLLFSAAALPCILTQRSLTLLIRIWIPVLCALLAISFWLSRRAMAGYFRERFSEARSAVRRPARLIFPALAAAGVLLVLYLSVTSYYMGWDTAFYVRTVLNAVQNDSMYTLDAATGGAARILSLRYALSPFYMNSAVFSRLLSLHPLLVQNLTDGSICVILAFTVIYLIGLALFPRDRGKAYLVVLFAAALHLGHVSLFSASEFLILRSYEAKACCANLVLPFLFYCMLSLWKTPGHPYAWKLLFLCAAAANPVSLSSMFTVPLMLGAFAAAQICARSWRALCNTVICMIPCLLYIGAYLLEYSGLLTIPVR